MEGGSQENRQPSRQERNAEEVASCQTITDENIRWLPDGFVLKNEWTVQAMVRRTSYSQEYSGKNVNTERTVSIRFTRAKRRLHPLIAMELEVSNKMSGSSHFATMYDFGMHGDYHYFVYDQLGPSLAELLKANPRKGFSHVTVLLIGIGMIETIKNLHQNGFLHRNITPSNFVMGSHSTAVRKLYIRNFATCRAYCTDDGEVYPPRTSTHYQGDSVYSSADCLRRRECGRKDDFWSVFYIMIKMASGQLPWETLADPIQIVQLKETISNSDLLRGCPAEFDNVRKHISSLNYYSCPDYNGMIEILEEALVRRGGNRESKLDWEFSTSKEKQGKALE